MSDERGYIDVSWLVLLSPVVERRMPHLHCAFVYTDLIPLN